MTTLELARRLGAQPRGNRWSALCPGHDDRRPSLSISEGRGGRTVLRCFAGCDVEAIVAGMGLKVSDLFADTALFRRGVVHATIENAQAALDGELAAILDREEQRLGFRPLAVTRFKNEARASVERRFDVRLARRPAPWWEVEPHAIDPEWKALVDRAIEEAAFARSVAIASIRGAVATTLDLQDDVLQRARQTLRELANSA